MKIKIKERGTTRKKEIEKETKEDREKENGKKRKTDDDEGEANSDTRRQTNTKRRPGAFPCCRPTSRLLPRRHTHSNTDAAPPG